MLIRNKDQRSTDYLDNNMTVAYCLSYADATYNAKYEVLAIPGGGRSLARETIGCIAAKHYSGDTQLAMKGEID